MSLDNDLLLGSTILKLISKSLIMQIEEPMENLKEYVIFCSWNDEISKKIFEILSSIPFVTVYMNYLWEENTEGVLMISIPLSAFERENISIRYIPQLIQGMMKEESPDELQIRFRSKLDAGERLPIMEIITLLMIELSKNFDKSIPLLVKFDSEFLWDLNTEIRKKYTKDKSMIDPPMSIALLYEIDTYIE